MSHCYIDDFLENVWKKEKNLHKAAFVTLDELYAEYVEYTKDKHCCFNKTCFKCVLEGEKHFVFVVWKSPECSYPKLAIKTSA
jgi:hypothetical protein